VSKRGFGIILTWALLAGCYAGPAPTPIDAIVSGSPAADESVPGADPSGPAPTSLRSGFEASSDFSPAPAPAPTQDPTPEPTPTPRPEPSVELRVNGIQSPPEEPIVEMVGETVLTLITHDLQRSECSLESRFVPDKPGHAESTKAYAPLANQTITLKDGAYTFVAICPSIDGRLKAAYGVLAVDGLPERCLGFDFERGAISATTVSELASGMVGSWSGCADTPWTPVYWVDFTFRADGGYSAVAGEVLDGSEMRATYYGLEADHPGKQWFVLEMIDGEGFGRLDIVDEPQLTVLDMDLRSIRLMGDTLTFELFHVTHEWDYGPLVFRLIRN